MSNQVEELKLELEELSQDFTDLTNSYIKLGDLVESLITFLKRNNLNYDAWLIQSKYEE